MPLLAPPEHPPFNITRLSHCVLECRDLAATRHFYETGLGLEVTSEDEDRLYLRALEEWGHHSLVFEKKTGGGSAAAQRIGFRVASDGDLDAAFDWFSSRGTKARAPRGMPHPGDGDGNCRAGRAGIA